MRTSDVTGKVAQEVLSWPKRPRPARRRRPRRPGSPSLPETSGYRPLPRRRLLPAGGAVAPARGPTTPCTACRAAACRSAPTDRRGWPVLIARRAPLLGPRQPGERPDRRGDPRRPRPRCWWRSSPASSSATPRPSPPACSPGLSPLAVLLDATLESEALFTTLALARRRQPLLAARQSGQWRWVMAAGAVGGPSPR